MYNAFFWVRYFLCVATKVEKFLCFVAIVFDWSRCCARSETFYECSGRPHAPLWARLVLRFPGSNGLALVSTTGQRLRWVGDWIINFVFCASSPWTRHDNGCCGVALHFLLQSLQRSRLLRLFFRWWRLAVFCRASVFFSLLEFWSDVTVLAIHSGLFGTLLLLCTMVYYRLLSSNFPFLFCVPRYSEMLILPCYGVI